MSVNVDEFGQVLHKWQEENTMPWGRLRYHSARRNIAKRVEDRPLRILGIGGGDGRWLITIGHGEMSLGIICVEDGENERYLWDKRVDIL